MILKIVSAIISMIKTEDFDIDKILIDKESLKNVLVYDVSYKNFSDSKPLGIRFDKIDGFIRVYDGTRYLVLPGSEKEMIPFTTGLDIL